jgi:MFS family permease
LISRYQDVLKNEVVKKLSIVFFTIHFSAWFSYVAIFSLLLKFGADDVAISYIGAMFFAPAIILAPISGAIIDRFDTRILLKIFIITELFTTLFYLNFNSLDFIWILALLIFIRSGASSLYFATQMSLMPNIVKSEDLQTVNEIQSIIWSLSFTLGMAIGGIVVSIIGEYNAIKIDIVLFLIALYSYSTIKFEPLPHKENIKITTLIIDGLKYFKDNSYTIKLIFLHASVAFTSFDTLVVLLANTEYKPILAVALAIGLTNASRAFGLMIGPFILGNIVNKSNFAYILLAQALSIVLWAYLQFDFYYGIVSIFLVGIFTTTIWSYTYALIQNYTEDKYLGRVLAYNDMIFMSLNVGVTLMIGYLSSIGVSLFAISILLSLGFVATAIFYKKLQ